VAGSFYIFAFRVYQPGDRIEINNIRGDVIDINSMYTTNMEMGEWVSSDNYSGRIVKISNAFVL
jgi:small-conductance mechanosensitive channel